MAACVAAYARLVFYVAIGWSSLPFSGWWDWPQNIEKPCCDHSVDRIRPEFKDKIVNKTRITPLATWYSRLIFFPAICISPPVRWFCLFSITVWSTFIQSPDYTVFFNAPTIQINTMVDAIPAICCSHIFSCLIQSILLSTGPADDCFPVWSLDFSASAYGTFDSCTSILRPWCGLFFFT